ncbi:hypothetical protein Pmani_028806 [Petrolisthes manimaculis]|uniref:Four-jointed box protein 1 n=1 Tax=Petrolisthes manimaculis TaxID=1843537 RepID=A0AAE1TV95_9EUCA|nr:hypothetical protein Pmani_028806 [Petrolisthes manimaculis]
MAGGVVYRGRGDNMKGSLSIALPAPPLPPRASRLACLAAATVAFLVGVAVGVTLPLVLTSPPEAPPHSLPRHVQAVEASTESGGGLVVTAPLHTWAPPPVLNSEPNLAASSAASNISEQAPVSSGWTINSTEWLNKDLPLDVAENQVEWGDMGSALLEDEVYWGAAVEEALPRGFPDSEVESWRKLIRRQAVARLQDGCGRMQNRLLTFTNGTRSCCRYRQNHDQIQGEIFSFYLSRLLGLTNVPPSALGVVRAGAWQWAGVGNQLALAQWAEERPVVMTRFVEDLAPAHIPVPLRPTRRRLHPLEVESLDPRDLAGLAELAQWSDLIVFDYLTANLDRVVNNLYNMQWNPGMMEAPAHNLARHVPSGLLVFLDNESGLLHGYRLLDKYETFHASLLNALCVFRRSTADSIKRLVMAKDVGERLKKMFRRHEPDLQDVLPPIPDKSVKILNERLASVHKQISRCERMYRNS